MVEGSKLHVSKIKKEEANWNGGRLHKLTWVSMWLHRKIRDCMWKWKLEYYIDMLILWDGEVSMPQSVS